MNTKIRKNSIVGLKELRENMEVYIKRVNKGESLTVFRRSTPLFQIAPIDEDDDGNWETIVDFVKEFGAAVPATELLASMETYGQKRKIS